MATPYPYATGKDPEFDAWKAQSDYQRTVAEQDAELRRKQADEAYAKALDDLQAKGEYGTRAIDNSMLERGVWSSGETNRRQAELQAELLRARGDADTAKANLYGQASTDLQRALTMLSLDNEQQVAAAMARQSAGSGGGGGGGSGGRGGMVATPTATAPVDWQGQMSAGLGRTPQAPIFRANPSLPPSRPKNYTTPKKPATSSVSRKM